ncbi:MAG: hypothetical protein IJ315_05620 [Firmicutes bacterium]|nr:hypothetical protein [Bacillota bacterium]
MLLNARQVAYLGVLLAVCEVCLYMSAVLEINTLALLFVAACCVGISCILTTPVKGGIFLVAAILLGYLILPNKLYLITFAGLGVYILILEGVQPRMLLKWPVWIIWGIKLAVFNVVYVPLLIFVPQILYSGEVSFGVFLALLLADNAVMVGFDYLYLSLESKYGAQIQALIRRR